MALFGFKKKKEPVSEPKKEPEQPKEEIKADFGPFYMKNGMWMYDPDLKPKVQPEKPKIKVKITRGSDNSVWSEPVEAFLARNDDAILVRLESSPEEKANCKVGNRCYVREDDDNPGIYYVTCGGKRVGRLPESCITYAEENDTKPEFLIGIIKEIEYGAKKSDDIVIVYIAT